MRREESQGGRRRVKEDTIGYRQPQIEVISGTMQKDLNLNADVKFNFVKSDRVPDL